MDAAGSEHERRKLKGHSSGEDGTMACKFNEVLDDEFVAVVEHKDEMGECVDRIGNRGTPVSMELGGFMTTERTKYRPSHAIKTPMLAGPYRTSLPFGDDPGNALQKAIVRLTSCYRQAVAKGHEPSEDSSFFAKAPETV